MSDRRIKIRFDRDGDGKVTPGEIAENLGEMFSATVVGRWEAHLLVPAAKAFAAGLATGFATYVLHRWAFLYIPTLYNVPQELAMDNAITVGLLTFGVWLFVEMWISTYKPIKNARDKAYDEGYDDAEEMYRAQITTLQREVAVLKGSVGDMSHFSLTEEKRLDKTAIFVRLLFTDFNSTTKRNFTSRYGVTQAEWTTIRDTLASLAIIDAERHTLVHSQAQAEKIFNEYVEKQREMRQSGGVPAL